MKNIITILLAVFLTVTANANELLDDIRAQAKLEWPGDYSMQEYFFNQEVKAMAELCSIYERHKPNEDISAIIYAASKKWPNSYRMQAYTVKREIEAYFRLNQ